MPAPLKYSLFDQLASKKVILASSSPRRLEILTQIGLKDIQVIPPDFEEDLNKAHYTPKEYVLHTAIGKAKSVQNSLSDADKQQDTIIISSDTVIELNGTIYEKPRDKTIQFENLQKFRDSNKPLKVLSSVVIVYISAMSSLRSGCVLNQDSVFTHVEETKLYFDPTISDELIQSYVDSEEGLQVAAGFKIQSTGAVLIERIDGDYYNVVGLPLRATFRLLERALEKTV